MKSTQTKIIAGRPSLRDVAKIAQVSAAAVSYVVTGRFREVAPETRVRIEAAIKALKYQPQRRGQSLRFNREFAVGLVILDTDDSFLADPFTTHIASGLSNALIEPGYGLTVTGCRTLSDLEKLLRRPIGVDAFVTLCSGPKNVRNNAYRLFNEVNLPTVILQDQAPQAMEDTCSIMQDDYLGGQMLALHLLSRGVKRILFVSPSRSWPAIERREEGITSVLPHDCHFTRIECDEEDFDGTVAVVDQMLDSAPLPQAIMGANDQIAIAALHVLAHRKIQVPSAIQVTGFNCFAFRNYATPLLTTIKSNATEMGRRCAQSVLARIDSGAFECPQVELSVSLEMGLSTLQE